MLGYEGLLLGVGHCGKEKENNLNLGFWGPEVNSCTLCK